MKFNDLVLRGIVIKKKTPVPYEFQGRKGMTYTIFVDSFEDVYQVKVPEEVYNTVKEYNHYAFSCTVNIDNSKAENNSLVIKSILICTGDKDIDICAKTIPVFNQESLPLSDDDKSKKGAK